MNEAKRAANKRHAAKLDQLKVQPPEELGAQIRQAAKNAGESVQGYILTAVRARMDADSGEVIRISEYQYRANRYSRLQMQQT